MLTIARRWIPKFLTNLSSILAKKNFQPKFFFHGSTSASVFPHPDLYVCVYIYLLLFIYLYYYYYYIRLLLLYFYFISLYDRKESLFINNNNNTEEEQGREKSSTCGFCSFVVPFSFFKINKP